MKRFLFLFLSLFLISTLILPAYAAEAGEGETVVLVPDVVVNNEVNVTGEELGTYVGSSVFSYSSYSGEESSLKSVLLQFLGDWETVVVQHSYQTSDGSVNTVQETLPDYPWLCSAVLLCIMIFCLFRLGGAILCKT